MEYIVGKTELFHRVKPLWQKLNAHHHSVSPYFKGWYEAMTFEDRVGNIDEPDNVQVIIACKNGRDMGYIMAEIDESWGEIKSLFVEPEARGTGVADTLMEMTKQWFKEKGTTAFGLGVAYGNEKVFSFYARHGIYPRWTSMRTRDIPPK